jgi:hypothetical protein
MSPNGKLTKAVDLERFEDVPFHRSLRFNLPWCEILV